ncbi:MAG: hypothetical protein ACKOXB_09600 [Flavobacteriales bacterium]
MEKLGRLMGTLLVLSLMFAACKKDDFGGGKKGGKDYSFNDDFSKKKGPSKPYYNCSGSDHNDNNNGNHHGNHGHKLTICHNGHMITIARSAVFHHFKQHGTDMLFSCDATKGVTYDDIIGTLNKIIHDRNLRGNQQRVMQRAFNIWYNEYYLTGNWPLPVDNGGGGGAGGGDNGGSTGGDTTGNTDGGSGGGTTEPMMAVCHDGAVISVTYPVAFDYFQNGDVLFSCDPSLGVYYSDVEGPLLDIIYDYTLDETASDVMYQAFLIWHTDYYLKGNWPPDGGGAGGGGAGGGEGGTGTGSDTTVVINN